MANELPQSLVELTEEGDLQCTLQAKDPDSHQEISSFREARQIRVTLLAQTETRIEQFQAQRDKLRKEVECLDFLMGGGTPTPITSCDDEPQYGTARLVHSEYGHLEIHRQHPSVLSESVDAVFELLRQSDQPLHYREIHARVASSGIVVTGKDPAATLLARFTRDPRIQRVSSGTYTLSDSVSNH